MKVRVEFDFLAYNPEGANRRPEPEYHEVAQIPRVNDVICNWSESYVVKTVMFVLDPKPNEEVAILRVKTG